MNTESCFTTVLWMALLLGYLQVQAHPITTPQPARCSTEIDFKLLESVSCGKNATFVITPNVLLNCEANALETIMIGLNEAKNQCKDDFSRIGQAMDELKELQRCPRVASSKLQSEPSKCEWKHGSFKEFLNYFNLFLQQLSE